MPSRKKNKRVSDEPVALGPSAIVSEERPRASVRDRIGKFEKLSSQQQSETSSDVLAESQVASSSSTISSKPPGVLGAMALAYREQGHNGPPEEDSSFVPPSVLSPEQELVPASALGQEERDGAVLLSDQLPSPLSEESEEPDELSDLSAFEPSPPSSAPNSAPNSAHRGRAAGPTPPRQPNAGAPRAGALRSALGAADGGTMPFGSAPVSEGSPLTEVSVLLESSSTSVHETTPTSEVEGRVDGTCRVGGLHSLPEENGPDEMVHGMHRSMYESSFSARDPRDDACDPRDDAADLLREDGITTTAFDVGGETRDRHEDVQDQGHDVHLPEENDVHDHTNALSSFTGGDNHRNDPPREDCSGSPSSSRTSSSSTLHHVVDVQQWSGSPDHDGDTTPADRIILLQNPSSSTQKHNLPERYDLSPKFNRTPTEDEKDLDIPSKSLLPDSNEEAEDDSAPRGFQRGAARSDEENYFDADHFERENVEVSSSPSKLDAAALRRAFNGVQEVVEDVVDDQGIAADVVDEQESAASSRGSPGGLVINRRTWMDKVAGATVGGKMVVLRGVFARTRKTPRTTRTKYSRVELW